MLDDDELTWLDERMRGGFEHVLVGTSLPFLLAPGLHYVEAFSEALAGGGWGKRLGARAGELMRQHVDLEHWAAFQKDFQRVCELVLEVLRGERGTVPRTVTFLSGDVHHSYVSEARPNEGEPIRGRFIQAVCSPIRNPLPQAIRFATAGLSYGVAGPIGHVVAASAKVPKAPVDWRLLKGPWFDNNIATLEIRPGEGLRMWWATGEVEDGRHDKPRFAQVAEVDDHVSAGAITDVDGIRVGQAQRVGDGWLTGVTVVLPPPEGAVAGVDVRGGGPGTRETDLLDPRNLVDRVHAIVLTGGSALGLAAADGVAQALLADGVGFPVGMPPQPGHVVPIVPAAVIFDLGRGGAFGNAPDAALGAEAYAAASTNVAEGSVGAGTGAAVGGLKGGVGTASVAPPRRHHRRRARRRQRSRVGRRPADRRAVRRPALRAGRPARPAPPRPGRRRALRRAPRGQTGRRHGRHRHHPLPGPRCARGWPPMSRPSRPMSRGHRRCRCEGRTR